MEQRGGFVVNRIEPWRRRQASPVSCLHLGVVETWGVSRDSNLAGRRVESVLARSTPRVCELGTGMKRIKMKVTRK